MNALLVFMALFAMGLFQDALSAFYLRLVSEKRIVAASIVSVLITFIGYTVLVAIIESLVAGGVANIAAYAFGGGCGTYIGLYRKPTMA